MYRNKCITHNSVKLYLMVISCRDCITIQIYVRTFDLYVYCVKITLAYITKNESEKYYTEKVGNEFYG